MMGRMSSSDLNRLQTTGIQVRGSRPTDLFGTPLSNDRKSMFSRRPLLAASTVLACSALALWAAPALAKDTVKIAFIAPLTGGTSNIGLGGRNSADLAVRLRNADPKSRYTYELVPQDDECKPNVGVQVATKMAADRSIIAGVTHYCSVGRDRHRQCLRSIRHAGHRLGRGATRRDLWQRLQGGAPRQRHHDQPERGGGEVHDRPRLQEVGDHP